ncbi:MAG: hypothetical protein GY782_10820 [Gammaproteobacteria bacterium]|nr:hypothetical protein [Gammaproteobacteria bacterium]
MISDERIEQIASAMQSGSAVGMITMEQSLARLVAQGMISSKESHYD